MGMETKNGAIAEWLAGIPVVEDIEQWWRQRDEQWVEDHLDEIERDALADHLDDYWAERAAEVA